MKWMIVAVMAFTYPNGAKDYHIWPEPNFDSMEECMIIGKALVPNLRHKLREMYPGKEVEMISCVDLDVVNDLLAKDELKEN